MTITRKTFDALSDTVQLTLSDHTQVTVFGNSIFIDHFTEEVVLLVRTSPVVELARCLCSDCCGHFDNYTFFYFDVEG